MIKQQASALFDKQGHVLLQQISNRRESDENIQPISITDIDITIPDQKISKQDKGNTKSSYVDDEFMQNKYLDNSNSAIIFKTNNKEEQDVQQKKTDMQNFKTLTSQSFHKQMRAIAQSQSQKQATSTDKQSEMSFLKSDLEAQLQNGEKVFINKRNNSNSRKIQSSYEQKATIQSSKFLTSKAKTSKINERYLISKLDLQKQQSRIDIFMLLKKSLKQRLVKTLGYFLEKTEKRRFQNLDQKQIELINDKSYSISLNEEKKINKFKCFSLLQWKIISSTFQVKQLFKKYINKIPIILPTNTYNICLNLLQMSTILLLYFIYSFYIFFYSGDFIFTKYVEIFSLVVIVCDILTKFFVGIYRKGEIVVDRSLIFKSYFQSYFFIDFCSAVFLVMNILSLFDTFTSKAIIKSIFYIRIFSSQQTFVQIDHLIHIVGKAGNMYQLFKLILKCIILCHIISILLYQLAIVEKNYFYANNTWIDAISINESEWYDKYIFALYSSLNIIMLNTQNTLNTIEMAFVILVMYSTIGSFAFIMQCISKINFRIILNFQQQICFIDDILEQENKKTREFKADLETINQYMRKKNLKKELQSKVCNFLEYLYEEKGDIKNNKEALNVLKRLPLSLREDIQQDINQNVIEQFQFICKTFSDKIKRKTIQIIEEECFLPNEIIFKQGSFTNQALYLVQKGKVLLEKVKTNGETVTFCVLEKNGIFGETSFFSGLEFNYQVRSGDFTTLYKIPRKQFIEVIESSNDDFEQFCVMRDSILMQKNSPFLQVFCKICNSINHSENDCDKVHFSPNHQLIILKQQINFFQTRDAFKRKQRLRTNARHFVNQMRDVCDKINSDPDYITLIEQLELDNFHQSNDSESSFQSDRDSNLDELDDSLTMTDQADQLDRDNISQEQDIQNFKIENQNNQSQIYKIHSNYIDNYLQEIEESKEENYQQIGQKSLTILDQSSSGDQQSLSQLPGSQYLQTQNMSLQTMSQNNSSYLNLNQVNVNKYAQVMKINSIAQQFTQLVNQNINLNPQHSAKNVQNTRNQFSSISDIFKSNTINSQNTKKSKVQFEDSIIFEQQKSNFQRRDVKKKGVIPKSLTKTDTRSLNEQKTSQSRKENPKNNQENANYIIQQGGGIMKQLSKINSILEKQLSLVPNSMQKSGQIISVKSINNQQTQNQQIVQQLLLFDQIKQNLLELQNQNQQQITIFQNEFEKMKKYRIYYPLGNYTNVINGINRNLKLNFKSTKKRAHIRTWSFIKKLQSFSNQ